MCPVCSTQLGTYRGNAPGYARMVHMELWKGCWWGESRRANLLSVFSPFHAAEVQFDCPQYSTWSYS